MQYTDASVVTGKSFPSAAPLSLGIKERPCCAYSSGRIEIVTGGYSALLSLFAEAMSLILCIVAG